MQKKIFFSKNFALIYFTKKNKFVRIKKCKNFSKKMQKNNAQIWQINTEFEKMEKKQNFDTNILWENFFS